MVGTEDHIIAGISGGADSVCLFFVLLELCPGLGVPLTAVHVNHGLRGDAATMTRPLYGSCAENTASPWKFFGWIWNQFPKKGNNLLRSAAEISGGKPLSRSAQSAGGRRSPWRITRMTTRRHSCGTWQGEPAWRGFAASAQSTEGTSGRFCA